MLADSAPTVDARLRLAGVHVIGYLTRALAGSARFMPVSPFLADVLREREQWSINPAGVADAVERATALRGAMPADTTQRGMRRAGGPPPIPRDTAPQRYLR